MSRLVVFWKGGWRPLLRNYLPDLIQSDKRLPETDSENALLSEIKLANGKEEEGIKNYLRKHRLDSYILVPELSMRPLTLPLAKLRELSHILRPLVYASLVAGIYFKGRKSPKWTWAVWSATLVMDVFAEWPQIVNVLGIKNPDDGATTASPMEKEERQIRLVKMLLYLLREPVYSLGSKPYMESVFGALAEWRLLRPVIGIKGTLIRSNFYSRNGPILSKAV